MNSNILIRNARLDDSAMLGHVQLASWKTMFPAAQIAADEYLAQFSDEERAEAWQSMFARLPDRVVYAAETEDKQVVGFASSVALQPDEPYACELLAIHILPEYRAQGIGRRLIATTARHWHGQGCVSLWLWTLQHNPARAVYEHLGGVIGPAKTMCASILSRWRMAGRGLKTCFEIISMQHQRLKASA